MNKNFKAGVVSVTFRQYAYKNFIKYTKLTDLSCIEWGSDIHVPYDNLEKAQAVADEMSENNLETVSYGSYYRLSIGQAGLAEPVDVFPMILKTAEALKAPSIRVWGGILKSSELDGTKRRAIIDDAIRIAAIAKAADKDIALEYHGNTITDTAESALDFINAVRDGGGENIYLYWQPNQHTTFEENKIDLVKICPYLSNIHVFSWEGDERFPLKKHKDRWSEYIGIIEEQTDGKSNEKHSFMLEFVKDHTVEQFVEDAETLLELLK